MTSQPIKEDPVKRFRKLLGSLSPLTRLPQKAAGASSSSSKKPAANPPSSLPKQSQTKKDASPRGRVSQPNAAPVEAPSPASNADPKPDPVSKKRTYAWAPAFWTTASILSLTVNVILIIILLVLLTNVSRLQVDVDKIMGVTQDLISLPGGLYENFEKMDRASIQTNVKVETSIPVKFDLTLNQQTDVVLSQDVTINNALVTVNTGGLNITRANTTIVLPAGPSLPVFLNLVVPVDTQVPVVLDVPVNIPLSETELNEPFVGLQEVIKPLYCFLKPDAVNLDNQPICP